MTQQVAVIWLYFNILRVLEGLSPMKKSSKIAWRNIMLVENLFHDACQLYLREPDKSGWSLCLL